MVFFTRVIESQETTKYYAELHVAHLVDNSIGYSIYKVCKKTPDQKKK